MGLGLYADIPLPRSVAEHVTVADLIETLSELPPDAYVARDLDKPGHLLVWRGPSMRRGIRN